MNQTDNYVINTQGLSKTYKGVEALKPLDLQVRQNSIGGFLGPNGAGKSTTIKLLLGLSRPTGGSAQVFGMDSVRDSVAIRQRVGYLAQDPRYYDHMTARQTLRFTTNGVWPAAIARASHNVFWFFLSGFTVGATPSEIFLNELGVLCGEDKIRPFF